jgi:hypothetical protein
MKGIKRISSAVEKLNEGMWPKEADVHRFDPLTRWVNFKHEPEHTGQTEIVFDINSGIGKALEEERENEASIRLRWTPPLRNLNRVARANPKGDEVVGEDLIRDASYRWSPPPESRPP